MSEKNQSQNTENLGELLKIRREKLAGFTGGRQESV